MHTTVMEVLSVTPRVGETLEVVIAGLVPAIHGSSRVELS